MSATFTTIPTVAEGDKITSRQRNLLALGINDRLRSGIGDIPERIWFKGYTVTRAIQNPADENTFAAQDVWFSHYCHIPYGGESWPDLPINPSNPEGGPNVNNPLMAFIFGSSTFLNFAETRLNDIDASSSDPLVAWEFGKAQRGTVVLATESEAGLESSQFNTAVRSHLAITPGNWPYLVKWGGYYPYGNDMDMDFTIGDQMEEIMARYAMEFKGTTAQRADDATYRIQASAFDFEKFFESQFFLAPAQGIHQNGTVVANGYPIWRINSATIPSSGNLGELTTGGYGFDVAAGFVLAGYRVRGTAMAAATTAVLSQDDTTDTVFATISIPAGDSEQVVWIRQPVMDGSAATCFLLLTGSIIAPPGEIEVEAAILEKRKPNLMDAYVLLRRASTKGEPGFDNRGEDFTDAPSVSTNYFRAGCVVGEEIPDQSYPNENPVHEAARKLLRDRMRLLTRISLRGYAVENGKSVLWFSPTVNISGVSFNLFDGIVGEDGSNGIVVTAPPLGHSNEWVMHLSTNVYNDSPSSGWQPENFGDIIAFQLNRCHFLSDEMRDGTHDDVYQHIAPADFDPARRPKPGYPVSPSAFNYVDGLNGLPLAAQENDREKFFASCPLYPPPYEIEKAEMDGGEVKLTFKTRFRNTGGSGDIARGAVPDSEPYRTDENAVRQYLYALPCARLVGDIAGLQNLRDEPGTPNGSCHPRFYFTKLCEKVFEDTPENEDQEDTQDTRCLSEQLDWMHFVLDAGCEGFLDPQIGTGSNPCNARPAHYKFSTLCAQIDPAMKTFQFFDPEVNAGKGYGPVPNTKFYHKLFNNLANGFNLLTRVPVELPLHTQTQSTSRYLIAPAGLTFEPIAGPIVNGIQFPPAVAYMVGSPPNAEHGTVYQQDLLWVNGNSMGVVRSARGSNVGSVVIGGQNFYAGIYGELTGAGIPRMLAPGGNHQTLTLEHRTKLRVRVSHEPALENIIGLYEGQLSVAFKKTQTRKWFERNAPGSTVVSCGGSNWPNNNLLVKETNQVTQECVTVGASASGTWTEFDLPEVPDFHSGVLWWQQSSFNNPQCSDGPEVVVSAVARLAVFIATVPLV